MLRSIAVYYRKGVMGKDKYRLVYKDSSYRQVPGRKQAVRIKVANCPSPRLVPYHRLMSYIKSIDIGQLHSVRENLCDELDECDKCCTICCISPARRTILGLRHDGGKIKD